METREKIINATFDVISKSGGVDNFTTKKISESMNMSTGIIHHHFDTKEKLVYETYMYFIDMLKQKAYKILSSQAAPIDKIKRLTRAQFDRNMMNSLSKNMWVYFWNDSINKPSVARLLHIYSRRFVTNLFCCFNAILQDRTQARTHAQTYFALIRGLWLETVISKTVQPNTRALELLFNYLNLHFGE